MPKHLPPPEAPENDPVPSQDSPAQPSAPIFIGAPVGAPPGFDRTSRSSLMDDIPGRYVPGLSSKKPAEHRLPPPPADLGGMRWVPAGEPINVGGIQIPGGMLYFGVPLRNAPNPACINPNLEVDKKVGHPERKFYYWGSYADIGPAACRVYLEWLATARDDPETEIGLVFMYFYGLEYRALLEAETNLAARAEIPQILLEVRRLLDVYGNRDRSFKNQAYALSELLSVVGLPGQLYRHPVPDLPVFFEVPNHIRLALGSAVVDKAPLPAALAYAWVVHDPRIRFRTAALRCSEEFVALFALRYTELFGAGMRLPRNKTKFRVMYPPASPVLARMGVIQLGFGDIPDLTASRKPIKQLADLTEAVTRELDAYSRYLGRNPEAENTVEGLLLLPFAVWPAAWHTALGEIKARVGDTLWVASMQALLSMLSGQTVQSVLTREQAVVLANALESVGIAIEPDMMGSTRLPRPDVELVLFAIPAGEPAPGSTPAYEAAALTLQLASAAAAGDFSAGELHYLQQQIASWVHLSPSHVCRLKAQLRLLMLAPASLTTVKKKLEPFAAATKEKLGLFVAAFAQADGAITPAKVKMLERIYKILGLDPLQVFSDIHALAAPVLPGAVRQEAVTGFKLDPARIAALQSDTAKVSALLATIFSEEIPPAMPVVEQTPASITAPALPGLDAPHSAFARRLISRPQWAREELQVVAAEMDLMLDGALERINEAAYDTHDIPFTEGEDPVEVNAEIIEKIEA